MSLFISNGACKSQHCSSVAILSTHLKKKKRKIKQHSLGGSSLFWLFVFPWHCKCQDRCECQLQELLPVCSSRWVLQCQGSLSAKSNPLTDLILRLWTPSPQAGRSSTVLMVQMDQGSILHSYWLHSRWHRTASYTCTHACANGKGDIRGITGWKQLSVLAWKDKQMWIPTQACYNCTGGDCQGHSVWRRSRVVCFHRGFSALLYVFVHHVVILYGF